ncbi:MAG: OsmC family peroxiredoxin [Acidobacteria bacterium]|jgi:osmotically inducible protein OsmC|nr:OsmC family peroxiredoxin [Acidobacteriota bacterium]
MEFSRQVSINWAGSIMEGKGTVKAGSGAFDLPVTFPRRIGEPEGMTSPEELMAAAHAACYAMALNGFVGRKGGAIGKTTISCKITADKTDAGITITSSALSLTAEGLTGIDEAGFREAAETAKANCPVSKAYAGSMAVTLDITIA